MRVNLKLLMLLTLIGSVGARAQEQVLDDQDIVNIESLYSKPANNRPQVKPVEEVNSITTSNGIEASVKPAEDVKKNVELNQAEEAVKAEKIQRLTDLNRLSPFREVSVIQKKFLPKTGRFQFFAGGGLTTNSPWFLNLGLKLNIGYFFTESFGLELGGMFLSNSERDVAKEIRENNELQPEKFINTKNHVGLDFVWAPIYGKVTLGNNRIIPFDMYFSGGVGSSSTNSKEKNNTTFHVGTGQIFAITKSMAFRWDYSWNFFQATPFPDAASNSTKSPESSNYNDLILTAGVSFFFPEVSNR